MTIKDNNVHTGLREQMLHAIQAVRVGRVGEINVSNQSHNTIAEALHDFVYSEYVQDTPPLKIDIIYSDGPDTRLELWIVAEGIGLRLTAATCRSG